MNMNAVGIDVSKGKHMVAILRLMGRLFLLPLKSNTPLAASNP